MSIIDDDEETRKGQRRVIINIEDENFMRANHNIKRYYDDAKIIGQRETYKVLEKNEISNKKNKN